MARPSWPCFHGLEARATKRQSTGRLSRNNLLCKYIYGPGIDQPVCMIEVADNNEPYYYHYDALGSVVALSDSSGDTVQTYEYSVYGQPAVEDINHPNPYMFAGRRFDIEIGLYYNRNRYYNPYTGRFLQTDPVGDGMNLYAYCGNNPVGRVDPSGLYWTFLDSWYVEKYFSKYSGLVFAWVDDDGDGNEVEPDPKNVEIIKDFSSLDAWYKWAPEYFEGNTGHAEGWDETKQIGYELSQRWRGGRKGHSRTWFFWRLQALRFLSSSTEALISGIEGLIPGKLILYIYDNQRPNRDGDTNFTVREPGSSVIKLKWDTTWTGNDPHYPIPIEVSLTHELYHAYQGLTSGIPAGQAERENPAIGQENMMRLAFYWKVPGYIHLWPLRELF